MLARARWVALLLPLALIAGALIGQYAFHLVPCEMCHWQRWPLYGAIVVAGIALLLRRQPASRALTLLAGLLILASGAIGLWQAGAEYHWWHGPQHCTGLAVGHGADLMRSILAQPLVQCDVPQWTLFGISLAGFNALFSGLGGLFVVVTCLRHR